MGRRALLYVQKLLRKPDDPDFNAFRSMQLEDRGLILDIGANGGQSAIAFSFLFPQHRIVSFEPNPALWPDLDFIKRLIGDRFRYERLALANEPCSMKLYVPFVRDFPVTTRASLSREAAQRQCGFLKNEGLGDVDLRETVVEVVEADSLGLSPDIVKIDVEGFELGVLEGMQRTLERSHPLLLVESNENDAACHALLEGLGYSIRQFDAATHALVPVEPGVSTRNWFAVWGRENGNERSRDNS